ncbi:hypothetical protein HY772_10155 [Candidatus Woesearchaeota archaeon]|nr:hypothetical protein [Candidatus Woesearchaeota archaeon]
MQTLDQLPQLPQLPLHIGNGRYAFDCELWNNRLQEHAGAIVLVDVPSLSALNRAVSEELEEAWVVSNWRMIT